MFLLHLASCDETEKSRAKILWKIEGPFSKEQIKSEFGLDSISEGNDVYDLFILTIENNHSVLKTLETNKQHQIFPYSSHIHSYNPYSAKKRSWKNYSYPKDTLNVMYIDSLMEKGEKSKFWFSSFFDTYVDTLYAHFEFKDPKTKDISQRTFWKNFERKAKPNIKFQLIEVDNSKINTEENEIIFNLDGPFTYAETNKLLNINIEYLIDSEEVFHMDVKNNRNDTVYIESWLNKEILMDTIYSYNTFTQSSIHKQWNALRVNKSKVSSDTIKILPNETQKFWFYFTGMTPKIDSIAFAKTFVTDKYLITDMKIYEVNKSEN